MVNPPAVVTVTGPTGDSQSMLRAESVTGVPTTGAAGNCTADRRGLLAQLVARAALSLFPVMVEPVMAATVSPLLRMRFLMAPALRAGFWALRRAASPDTCGAAIEVPDMEP
jgi:hypothetical protein